MSNGNHTHYYNVSKETADLAVKLQAYEELKAKGTIAMSQHEFVRATEVHWKCLQTPGSADELTVAEAMVAWKD